MDRETTKRNNCISGEVQQSFVCDLLTKTLYRNMICALPFSVLPSFMYFFQIKVIKGKLCESSSRFGGMKMYHELSAHQLTLPWL